MQKILRKRVMAVVLSMSILGLSLPATSYASMINTQSLIQTQILDESRARISQLVSQENVTNRMLELGVDPADIQARIAALTDDEVRQLEQHLDELPAGGILATIGLVFVILLILELTGVIDIFKKT
jgi:hypothetical protein